MRAIPTPKAIWAVLVAVLIMQLFMVLTLMHDEALAVELQVADSGDVFEDEAKESNEATGADTVEVLDSGTWGTCPWEITSDRVLTIYPGENWFSCQIVQIGYTNYNMMYKTNLMNLNHGFNRIVFKEVDGRKVIAPSNCSSLFKGLYGLKSVDFSGLDTSCTTNMSGMFRVEHYVNSLNNYFNNRASQLVEADLSCLDLSNVTNMAGMFANCPYLERVNLSGLDLSKVTSMSHMFYECDNLQELEMASCDCSSVTDVSEMFHGSGLRRVSLPAFSADTPVNMYGMFWQSRIADFDHSSWSNQKASDTSYMFCGCNSLKAFDCTSLDVSNDASMECMFQGCQSVERLDVSGWHTHCHSYSGMFSGCSSVKVLDLTHFFTNDDRIDVNKWSRPSFDGCDSLECLVLGSGVHSTLSVSGSTANGHSNWFSCAARKWVSPINRVGIADTYLKYVPFRALSAYMDSVGAYSGKQICPTMYFYLKGDFTYYRRMAWGGYLRTDDEYLLKEGVDYTVSYGRNIDAGQGSITVTGKGDYIGTVTYTFNIAQASNNVATAKTSVTKQLTRKSLKKKAAYVVLPKAQSTFGEPSWSVSEKDKKKVLSLSNGKVKVRKGAKKGTYTIKLMASVSGSANYAFASSKIVTVEVKVK